MNTESMDKDVDAAIVEIEESMKKRELDRAQSLIDRLKDNVPDYSSTRQGYLIDYFTGQAIFCAEIPSRRFSPERVQEALTHFRKSSRLNPSFPDVLVYAGQAHMILGKYANDTLYTEERKAIFDFTKAVEIDPALKETVQGHLDSIRFRVGRDLTKDLAVHLIGTSNPLCAAWKEQFAKKSNIGVTEGDILSQQADAIVSPANSFGFMDGGLDSKLTDYFGEKVQERLQEKIRRNHGGELLVGQAEIVKTDDERFPYLISAPTMDVPEIIARTRNAYISMRAVLRAVNKYNFSSNLKITSLAIPGLGTGIGKIPPITAARQMRFAYENVLEGKHTSPETIADAMDFKDALIDTESYKRLKSRGKID